MALLLASRPAAPPGVRPGESRTIRLMDARGRLHAIIHPEGSGADSWSVEVWDGEPPHPVAYANVTAAGVCSMSCRGWSWDYPGMVTFMEPPAVGQEGAPSRP